MPSFLLKYHGDRCRVSHLPGSCEGSIGSSLTSTAECLPRNTVSLTPQLSNKTKVNHTSFQISSAWSQDKYLRCNVYMYKAYKNKWTKLLATLMDLFPYHSICRHCFICYQEFEMKKTSTMPLHVPIYYWWLNACNMLCQSSMRSYCTE